MRQKFVRPQLSETSVRHIAMRYIMEHYQSTGLLPTEEGVIMILELDSIPARLAAKATRAVFYNLESQGIITPPGPHTGHHHLTLGKGSRCFGDARQ